MFSTHNEGGEVMKRLKLYEAGKGMAALSLHPETAKELGIREERIQFRYGINTQQIDIALSPALRQNEIVLPQKLIIEMRIPSFPSFEVLLNEEGLQLGPYIGFLVAYRTQEAERYLKNLTDYVKLYRTIGGAVLAFALDGVDGERQTIRGYLFHPETKRWVRGTYSYPASIFIRGHVASYKWVKHFKSVIGNKIYNDFYFDKWEMHRRLQKSLTLSNYLPKTKRCASGEDVLNFLEQNPRAYVKPVDGTMGMGIMYVSRKKQGILVRHRISERNQLSFFRSRSQASAFFARRFAKRAYIIQRELPLLTFQNKMIDFRLIIVKNGEGNWEYMGVIARSGGTGSFISNISAGGRAETGEIFLRKALKLPNEEVQKLSDRMARLAQEVAGFFDAEGLHCGNLGIDVGIDAKKNLWIIEVQHFSPAHSIALDAGNPHMYVKILRNTVHYMKRLAGFKGEIQ